MTHHMLLLLFGLTTFACSNVSHSTIDQVHNEIKDTTAVEHYQLQHVNDSTPSVSIGSVSNGKLKNGKLIPFQGDNYRYFDTTSYLNHRAYVHDKVFKTVTSTYAYLKICQAGRQFTIMECSHKEGGKLYPHRTHQNGLSIDFMMPLVKNGEPFYDYDNTGQSHYLLDFDNAGRLSQDTTVSIDFPLVAQHILALDSIGKLHGIAVQKVIINTELKEELFAGEIGKKLRTSDVYIVQNLSPLINRLHDDHYHVDFKLTP